MRLIFQGGNEIVKLDIDRNNKKLIVATSKTNYRPTLAPWKSLFDPGKETIQERLTDKMNDEDFKKEIIRDMKTLGYELKGEN